MRWKRRVWRKWEEGCEEKKRRGGGDKRSERMGMRGMMRRRGGDLD